MSEAGTGTEATGYDCLSSRLVLESELRTFLLDCFEVAERELFGGHDDRVSERLRDIPALGTEVRLAGPSYRCAFRGPRARWCVSLATGTEVHPAVRSRRQL